MHTSFSRFIPAAIASFAVTLLVVVHAPLRAAEKESRSESKWDVIKTASGKITSTTVNTGGNNNRNNRNGKYPNTSNYRVKPQYIGFEVETAGMRIRYTTKGTGDRPDLRIEAEKEITKPNGDKDWQRVGLVGRARGDAESGRAFGSGPGRYRLELTGQNTEYTITIEQPIKK